MYSLINRYIDRLLETVNFERDIQPYVWLIESLARGDVENDSNFRRVYRAYWQLNRARLCNRFLDAYFKLLRQLRDEPHVNVEAVARSLLDVPATSKGAHKLQFSFASKLVHMLRPDQPVYDKMVERFYFLPEDNDQENIEARLRRRLDSYGFLVREYHRILGEGILEQAVGGFRARFRIGPNYSDQKVIDTLIWAFVKFLKGGALRDGDIQYR